MKNRWLVTCNDPTVPAVPATSQGNALARAKECAAKSATGAEYFARRRKDLSAVFRVCNDGSVRVEKLDVPECKEGSFTKKLELELRRLGLSGKQAKWAWNAV